MKPTTTRTLANGKDRELNRCQGVCVDGRQCGNHLAGDRHYCRIHGPVRVWNKLDDNPPRVVATFETRDAANMALFWEWFGALAVKDRTVRVDGKPHHGRIVLTYGRGRGRKRGRQEVWIEDPEVKP